VASGEARFQLQRGWQTALLGASSRRSSTRPCRWNSVCSPDRWNIKKMVGDRKATWSGRRNDGCAYGCPATATEGPCYRGSRGWSLESWGTGQGRGVRRRPSLSSAFALLVVFSAMLPSWAEGGCTVLEIAGHQGDLSDYVNGVYSAGEDGGVLTNGRLAYQKARGPGSEKHPEMFLMFRDTRWFVTFYVANKGKTMSAMGYFEQDTADAGDITAALVVAGQADGGVKVKCLERGAEVETPNEQVAEDPSAPTVVEVVSTKTTVAEAEAEAVATPPPSAVVEDATTLPRAETQRELEVESEVEAVMPEVEIPSEATKTVEAEPTDAGASGCSKDSVLVNGICKRQAPNHTHDEL